MRTGPDLEFNSSQVMRMAELALTSRLGVTSKYGQKSAGPVRCHLRRDPCDPAGGILSPGYGMQDRARYSRKPASYSVASPGTRSTSPSDLRARQRRHWLPALHFPRCDCRAHRQVDHDHQPVASLNTIAPDGSSGSSPATTAVPSKPDCAGSELISCTVASLCLRHDTLGARHP